MKFKGIIFDLDGVIIHTDELHYMAWKAITDKLSIPFNRKINDQLRGVSRMESLDIILAQQNEIFSQTEKELLAEEKNEIYKKSLEKLTPNDVSESTLATMHSLKSNGYRLAIGSSSKNAGAILRNIGLYDFFDALSDGNNITHSKPHPEVFLKAAKFLLLSPSECVVIEDARAGVDAAVAGGFCCFGIGDASNYEKATWLISSLTEIEDCLESQPALSSKAQ